MCFKQYISVSYALKEGHFRELKLTVHFTSLLILRPSRYTPKIQLTPETKYTKVHSNSRKAYICSNAKALSNTNDIHTPVTLRILFQGIIPMFFLAFGIMIWREKERDRRETALPATLAGLECRLPSSG